MKVLGLDPGIALLGYGIVERQPNNKLHTITYGCIKTTPKFTHPERLAHIHEEFSQLLSTHKPDAMAVEQLFFAKNTKTAMAVSQARGVILALGALAQLEITEYTPNMIKQTVAGYGGADKGDMQKMVKLQLNMKELPKPDDAADALAVALCRIFSTHYSLPT